MECEIFVTPPLKEGSTLDKELMIVSWRKEIQTQIFPSVFYLDIDMHLFADMRIDHMRGRRVAYLKQFNDIAFGSETFLDPILHDGYFDRAPSILPVTEAIICFN